MTKLIGIAIIAAAIVAMGCGGGQMTVAEYAEWCGALEEQSATDLSFEDMTNGQALKALNEGVIEYNKVSAPDVLKELHNIRQGLLQSSISVIASENANDEFNAWGLLGVAFVGGTAALEAVSKLPPSVHRQLVEAECIGS